MRSTRCRHRTDRREVQLTRDLTPEQRLGLLRIADRCPVGQNPDSRVARDAGEGRFECGGRHVDLT